MEALAGLKPGSRLVINPTDDLREGLVVDAKPADSDPQQEGAAPKAK